MSFHAGLLPLFGIFPSKSLALGGTIALYQFPLLPEEEASLGTVADKRRKEYTAGRALSRTLLGSYYSSPWPLLADTAGVPVWPERVVGSIAHTGEFCWVVVGLKSELGSVGLDVEEVHRVSKNLWPKLLLPEERTWVLGFAKEEQTALATLIFSAKEAFYKYQYILTRQWLSFTDVTISADLSMGTLRAKRVSVADKATITEEVPGKFVFFGNLVASVFAARW